MSKRMPVKNIALTVICSAVLAACGGGGSSPETKLVDNAVSARKVVEAVESLPSTENLTANDVTALNTVVNRYNNLPEAQKSLVSKESLDRLKQLTEVAKQAEKSAGAVMEGIAALPLDVPQSKQEEVKSARAGYEALTAAQKTWVTEAALKHLAQTEDNIAANIAGADKFSADVNELPQAAALVKADVAKVESVRQAYTALSDVRKSYLADEALVNLANREKAINENQKAAENVIGKIRTLADDVASLITVDYKLDQVNDKESALKKWEEANKAFAALTNNQKTWLQETDIAKLSEINTKVYVDNRQLEALNLADPNPKVFLNEAINETAQQFNPHFQLKNNGSLLTNQTPLIKQISVNEDIKEHDSISIQGITFESNGDNPSSSLNSTQIAKINSKEKLGNQDIDVSLDAVHHLNQNKEEFDKKFDSIYAIQAQVKGASKPVTIILRDPAANGWHYQTFAHYVDSFNNVAHGYQSIGLETPKNALPQEGTATYSGMTTAYLVKDNESVQLTADVTAVADFAKKGLRFETTNTYSHKLENGQRISEAKSNYNMNGLAQWSANENSFKGKAATADRSLQGVLLGKFYGEKAAEIGGTYGLSNKDQQLIGGYGAKRQ